MHGEPQPVTQIGRTLKTGRASWTPPKEIVSASMSYLCIHSGKLSRRLQCLRHQRHHQVNPRSPRSRIIAWKDRTTPDNFAVNSEEPEYYRRSAG
eukprot:353000-Chlamydomonas_euryale.AAC.6